MRDKDPPEETRTPPARDKPQLDVWEDEGGAAPEAQVSPGRPRTTPGRLHNTHRTPLPARARPGY